MVLWGAMRRGRLSTRSRPVGDAIRILNFVRCVRSVLKQACENEPQINADREGNEPLTVHPPLPTSPPSLLLAERTNRR